jgi:hypothetical protein
MSTKKTIQINPELFKMSGSKTRKNKEKKSLALNPIISPNSLKNKLLKRIKEHKTREVNKETHPSTETNNYTDEFYGAINYLSDLTKKQKQQSILHNKTLKTHTNIPVNYNSYISVDLPQELEDNKPNLQTSEVFNVNYKPNNDDVPYGCLKNGRKKTYREWKELTRVNEHPDIPDLVRPPTPPKKNVGIFLEGAIETPQTTELSSSVLSRADRLEKIKTKLKQIQEQDNSSKMKEIDILNTLESKIYSEDKDELQDLDNFEDNSSSMPNIVDLIKERNEKIERENPKKYFKKTIKRRFTLGKSDKLRKVAVLIKDKQTRKNIINTQKELKKTNITDVRKYLRQHGIIKIGSTCPQDILRKTFEDAMLTGEITNTNKDILLHNFLNDDKSS